MLECSVALAKDKLHHSFCPGFQRLQICDMRDKTHRLVYHGSRMFRKDLVTISPNGDLRRLLLVLMALTVGVLVTVTASRIASAATAHCGDQNNQKTRPVQLISHLTPFSGC